MEGWAEGVSKYADAPGRGWAGGVGWAEGGRQGVGGRAGGCIYFPDFSNYRFLCLFSRFLDVSISLFVDLSDAAQ